MKNSKRISVGSTIACIVLSAIFAGLAMISDVATSRDYRNPSLQSQEGSVLHRVAVFKTSGVALAGRARGTLRLRETTGILTSIPTEHG
jgi:hypothetical protein